MTTDVLDGGQTLQDVQIEMFDAAPFYVEPLPKLSVGRRRTERQHYMVAIGVHPLAQRAARPDLGTCGQCHFRAQVHGGNRSYPKCTFDPARVTHGEATDCRAWWPACPDFKPKGSS